MSYLWIVRFCILMLVQVITSVFLIYKGKKRLSYFSEIFFSLCSILYGYLAVPIIIESASVKVIEYIYANYSFTQDKFLWYIVEYIVLKVLIVILIWLLKHFSFKALVNIAKKRKIIWYKIFGKTRFIWFVSRMWNKVDYGIRIKKGMPGKVNKKHRATGIQFDKDGFPVFKSIVSVKLERRLHKKTREVHFYHCNKELYNSIQRRRRLAAKFTKSEIQDLKNGVTPPKYTWHHHQDRGVLKLVERKVHEEVNHRGGYAIWGKRE